MSIFRYAPSSASNGPDGIAQTLLAAMLLSRWRNVEGAFSPGQVASSLCLPACSLWDSVAFGRTDGLCRRFIQVLFMLIPQ